MGRRIKVTEENYLDILARIQRKTNRFRCFEHYRCVDMKNPGKPKLLSENKSWGTTYKIIKRDLSFEEERRLIESYNELQMYEKQYYKFNISKFLHVTEHRIRRKYLEHPDSYDAKFYESCKFKPLILLDLGASCALTIDTGSKVEFTSYGFIVYVMHGVLDKDKDTWYIYRFITDRSNKIEDLEAEIKKRDQEWAGDAEFYNQLEEDADYDEEEDWIDLVGSECSSDDFDYYEEDDE